MSNSNNKLSLAVQITSLLIIALAFSVFRIMEKKNQEQIRSNIAALLRDELSVSNSYALSKSIVDLEQVGIIKCAALTEVSNANREFYSSMNSKCPTNFVYQDKFELIGLNGQIYEVEYRNGLNWYAIFLEVLLYFILGAVGITLPRHYENRFRTQRLKAEILKFERESLEKLTNRASHDIASPLSAIRLIASLIKNVDVEILEVLNSSILRTQEIFENLKEAKAAVSPVPVYKLLMQIILEKTILWGENPFLLVNEENNDFVVGRHSEIKRIFSNLLDNCWDARSSEVDLRISVRIEQNMDSLTITLSDNGRGIPSEIIGKIGTYQFSYGKAGRGSGIGIYSTIQELNQWGGKFNIESTEGKGTDVSVRFLKIGGIEN